MWWESFVKLILRQTFTWEGTTRRRDRQTMENFCYEVLNNLLRAPTDHLTKATKLKHMKAKFTRLHHEEYKLPFLNNAERDSIRYENPSLYHLIRARKRQETRML